MQRSDPRYHAKRPKQRVEQSSVGGREIPPLLVTENGWDCWTGVAERSMLTVFEFKPAPHTFQASFAETEPNVESDERRKAQAGPASESQCNTAIPGGPPTRIRPPETANLPQPYPSGDRPG